MGEGEEELLVQEHQRLHRIEARGMSIVSQEDPDMEEMTRMRVLH